MSSLPLLPPPPPRFPQTFTDQDDDKLEPQANGYARGERQEERVGIEWRKVKTQGEEHVQRLEDRLKELSKRQGAESPARPPSLAEPDLAQLDDHEGDTRFHFEETEPTTDEAEGEAAGHEEEGRALLSIAEDEGEHGDPDTTMSTNGGFEDEEEDNEADLSGNDDEPRSRSQHPFQGMTAAQRISFSNSVRISGGIHNSHRPHRHRPAIETFPRRSPSTERTNPISSREPRPEATPSPLLVASVTSSSANTPSRATSPSGRIPQHSSLNLLAPKPRRLSSSSHVSSNYAYPYAYSASPGSQVPSRGSSPCSSIYAPLQPPSKHTPNPLFVRPSQRLQRNRSSSGLSFQEYLRDGYDAFGGSDDDSDAITPKSPGYRELVEQQRRKRAKWEERRRKRGIDDHNKRKKPKDQEDEVETGGFWESLKKILAMGNTGGAGRAGGSFGSPTVFRHSSRLPSNANYGSTSNSTPAPPAPPQPPSKPRGILTSSRSVEDIHPPPPRPRTRSARSHSNPPVKTELDARFGTAPFRYFTIAFLLFKIHQLVAAIKDLFSTASKGMAKQKERERLLRQRQGYEAV